MKILVSSAKRGSLPRIAQQIAGLLEGRRPRSSVSKWTTNTAAPRSTCSPEEMARELGLDVPIYTRTGWPALTTPMPSVNVRFTRLCRRLLGSRTDLDAGKYWSAFRFPI